ncbi:MAG: cell division protein FtsA, partial [bacterium]
ASAKVCVCVGEIKKNGKIEIIGIGTKPCSGLHRGMVSNISQTTASIEQSMSKAELMSGSKIESVTINISGSSVKGITNPGMIAIKKGGGITKLDVKRVIETAKAVNIAQDMEILHYLPQSYRVDDQDGIEDPVGMIGMRLETEVYFITAKKTAIQNLMMCVEKAGLKMINQPVLSLLAGAEAVLSPDEKHLGVALIDIGGGTTDMAIFIEGNLHHLYTISIGGTNITKDISIVLKTSFENAERIKRERGCCFSSLISENEEIALQPFGGQKEQSVPRHILSEVIQSRMEEMFSMLDKEITRFKPRINAGVVLIGGGAMMEGCVELCKEIFNLPVRLGIPQNIGGLVDAVSTPFYAPSVGLVMLSAKEHHKKGTKKASISLPWWKRAKDFFRI